MKQFNGGRPRKTSTYSICEIQICATFHQLQSDFRVKIRACTNQWGYPVLPAEINAFRVVNHDLFEVMIDTLSAEFMLAPRSKNKEINLLKPFKLAITSGAFPLCVQVMRIRANIKTYYLKSSTLPHRHSTNMMDHCPNALEHRLIRSLCHPQLFY